MKNLTKRLLIVTAALMTLGLTSNAFAVCTIHGKLTRIYGYAAAANDYGYYYLNPLHTGVPVNYVYYFYVAGDDDRVSDAVGPAAANGKNVQISGNAATCPTTGTYRYGGTVNYANVFYGY